MKALERFLRPEFLGRVDEVIVFNSLSVEDYCRISDLLLGELVEPLMDKGITFSWTDEVSRYIAEKSHGGQRGARDLRNNIRKEIEDAIASIIVENADNNLSTISVDIDDGKVKVTAV